MGTPRWVFGSHTPPTTRNSALLFKKYKKWIRAPLPQVGGYEILTYLCHTAHSTVPTNPKP